MAAKTRSSKTKNVRASAGKTELLLKQVAHKAIMLVNGEYYLILNQNFNKKYWIDDPASLLVIQNSLENMQPLLNFEYVTLPDYITYDILNSEVAALYDAGPKKTETKKEAGQIAGYDAELEQLLGAAKNVGIALYAMIQTLNGSPKQKELYELSWEALQRYGEAKLQYNIAKDKNESKG